MRPRVFGEALVVHEVNKLIDAFEYPDEIGGGGVVVGGGGGVPTIMLAASNSTEISKSKADRTCTGTDDHVEIQAALDSLPFGGGRIFFTEGEFHPDWDKIKIPNSGKITLQGVGMSTRFDMNDTNPTTGTGPVIEVVVGNGQCRIRDLWIEGPENGTPTQVALKLAGGGDKVTDVLITTFQGDGIQVVSGGGDTVIESCWIEASFGSAITIDTDRVRIKDCYLFSDSSSTDPVIELASSALDAAISGCYITGGGDGVGALGGNDGLKISDCTIFVGGIGVALIGATLTKVTDNLIVLCGEQGISLVDCQGVAVADNTVYASSRNATNTFDNIIVDGDSARNFIHDNTLVLPSSGPVPRYGVNIATTDECNIVVGNDLGDPDDYGTDALNDNGANTQLFWPNDATYGDNFTDCGTGS